MSLATRYRPQTLSDVVEQDAVKTILQQQLDSGEIYHAYLFVGSAGCGKTSIGRIFAKEINKGKGTPLELDAASNNSVDDIRNIIQQAKTKSMDSDYRVFILDEVHSLSNNAWQALLKILEEPPKTAVFILCTTNPEKIPKTILSRVQQFQFSRISQQGIVDRLINILAFEQFISPSVALDRHIRPEVWEAVEYIAKIADGGLRDALTLLEKCLAYSTELTVENVVNALGTVDYDVMFDLSDAVNTKNSKWVIEIIEKIYADGKDLKQFIKDFMGFLLDINKYDITQSFDYLQLPNTYEETLKDSSNEWYDTCRNLLPVIVRLNSDIKWDSSPKVAIEAGLLMECVT